MGSKMSLIDKEKRKLNTIHHGAYVSVVNGLEPKDYDKFSSCTSNGYVERLVHDYRKIIELIETSDPSKGKLSLVEKAVCLAMSLRNNKTIYLHNGVRKGSKLARVNEQLIVEALLYFLTCSNYRILDNHKKVLYGDSFDLSGYDKDHKRELASYKKQLVELLMQASFDDQAFMSILNQLYLRGVMYKEDISLDLEDKVRAKLTVFETMDVPRVEQSLNPEYMEFKKNRRF